MSFPPPSPNDTGQAVGTVLLLIGLVLLFATVAYVYASLFRLEGRRESFPKTPEKTPTKAPALAGFAK